MPHICFPGAKTPESIQDFPVLKTIEGIISEHGGMDVLQRGEAIRVCKEENKTLIVEYMGRSPTGKDAVAFPSLTRKKAAFSFRRRCPLRWTTAAGRPTISVMKKTRKSISS